MPTAGGHEFGDGGGCGVTMRAPSLEAAAMIKVRARETIVMGGRGFETPEPPKERPKRRPSPPGTTPPSAPVLSPRCCIVPVPSPPKEKFVDGGRTVQLEDGSKIRLNSPRLLQAASRTGVALEDIMPLKVGEFVLAAKREGGKSDAQASRIGTRRFNMHELLRQGYLAELLAARAELPEPPPPPPQASATQPVGAEGSSDSLGGQPKNLDDVMNLTANMAEEIEEEEASSAIKAQEEIRKKTLAVAQQRFEQEKNRLEQEELDKEAARAKVTEIRNAYFLQKAASEKELQDKRNKAFESQFKRIVKMEDDKKAATAQAKLDEVVRNQAETVDMAKRRLQEEEFMAKATAFNKKQVERVKKTNSTWKEAKQTQKAKQLEADAEAARAAVIVAERLASQHQKIMEKQQEKARIREERRQKALAAKAAAVEAQITAQLQKTMDLDARLSARDNSAQEMLQAKQKAAAERAERIAKTEADATAARLAKAEEEEARRELATARREEVLEVRAEGSRLERELKAAQAAKSERIREHEWHQAIESTEAKHRRLDANLQQQKEFNHAQGILAQQFFKQKLKLKTEQEKQWNKFNKMSITELQERAANDGKDGAVKMSAEEMGALQVRSQPISQQKTSQAPECV